MIILLQTRQTLLKIFKNSIKRLFARRKPTSMTYLALKRLAFRRLSIIKFTSSECRYWNQDVKICAVNLCAKIIVEKSDIYIDNVNNYRDASHIDIARALFTSRDIGEKNYLPVRIGNLSGVN